MSVGGRRPRLISLNGPPGIGKSTLARRYISDHALALDLDIDVVRSLLGRWTDEPRSAGLQARTLALAVARRHAADGYDVVVPQLVGRVAFLEELEELADDVGASFHELVLTAPREQALARYRSRAPRDGDPADLAVISRHHDDIEAVLRVRPHAIEVAADGDVEATYRAVLHAIGAGGH